MRATREGKTVYVEGQEIGSAKLECDAQLVTNILNRAASRHELLLTELKELRDRFHREHFLNKQETDRVEELVDLLCSESEAS